MKYQRLATLAATALLAVGAMGCSQSREAQAVDEMHEWAEKHNVTPTTQTTPEQPAIVAYGDSYTWSDGLKARLVKQPMDANHVALLVTFTNGTEQPVDLSDAYLNLDPARAKMDMGDLPNKPTVPLLPGESATFGEKYETNVPNAAAQITRDAAHGKVVVTPTA